MFHDHRFFADPVCRPQAVRTRHAQVRQRQRGIPDVVIDGILDFGTATRTPDGQAWRWTFGKRGWARFCAWMGRAARQFDRYRWVYVITSDDDVVLTAAFDWR
ncbi:MAG: hypothetical protein NZM40_02570 [Sphingomonadaceae bacterium]|uniref:hypothetical protein n=1 Tax=Thermaurantiacus sp. TaxID=2820283 RepID=UPI00298F189D|nr:hypothetical protein [Thermaurantiacus sp.]MCS6986308.1 hypothetical protein [Sphingomonadaceae bacterium]MDW8415757.1 hypothetical protein [Thermaurantiacus sp.]